MRTHRPVITVLAVMALLAACRSAPIQNVRNVPLGAPPGARVTMQDAARAISTAGKSLGWVVEEVRPGEMTGTLRLRKHVAVVAIRHDTSAFSIDYKDSQNLQHQGDEIHRKYNLWVQNLSKRIQAEMARLGAR